MLDSLITGNQFLRPVADAWGVAAVEAAGEAVLGYPASMVTTFAEAARIADYLTNQEK